MRDLVILTVGKPLDSSYVNIQQDYLNRLDRWFNVRLKNLLHSKAKDSIAAVREESTNLLASIDAQAFVVLLDEHGKQYNNHQLATWLERQIETPKDIVLIIGGSYGVDDRVKHRANMVWSFSDQVFPHKLMHILVAEQIYRSMAIIHSLPYHHQ